MSNETTKKVYEVEEIREILGVSKTCIYDFIRKTYESQKPFKVIKIGNLYRIPKASFDKWVDGDEE